MTPVGRRCRAAGLTGRSAYLVHGESFSNKWECWRNQPEIVCRILQPLAVELTLTQIRQPLAGESQKRRGNGAWLADYRPRLWLPLFPLVSFYSSGLSLAFLAGHSFRATAGAFRFSP
jgi:hypothetical protein